MTSGGVKLTSVQISLRPIHRNEISNRSEFSMETVNARSEIKLKRIIKVAN